MRISDWSSDVCSSDLHYMESATAVDLVAERIRALGFPAPGTYKQYAALSSIPETDGVPEAMEMVRLLVKAHEACAKTARSVFPIADKSADEQIGRASCRERVCQYVEISVVGVSFKNKQREKKRNQT